MYKKVPQLQQKCDGVGESRYQARQDAAGEERAAGHAGGEGAGDIYGMELLLDVLSQYQI